MTETITAAEWQEQTGRTHMSYLGIDPGASGAFAIINEHGGFSAGALFSESQPVSDLHRYSIYIGLAILEKVHSMPKQGVSSTFKFGTNFGWWQGVMDAYKIPYQLITPHRWMQGVLDSGDYSADHRLAYARRRWPDAPLKRKKDAGLADALCMAEYARKIHTMAMSAS